MIPLHLHIVHQLTPADIQFILDTLADSHGKRRGLARLLMDAETAESILDDRVLFQTVVDSPEQLKISTQLYFYILVRHTLRRAGEESREMAAYIALTLAEFTCHGLLPTREESGRTIVQYSHDLEARLQEATPSQRFFLHAAIGNHYLCTTGLFPGHVRRRAERWGAPDIAFYESLGGHNFRNARDHPYAREYALESIFDQLGSDFPETRRLLNDLAERLVFLS